MIPPLVSSVRAPSRWRTLAVAVAVSLSVQGLAADSDDPEREQASFKVLDGFDVRLFASEREGAVKPVAIRFDARGRLWLVGSTVYPQLRPGEVARDKITVLEDTDGDGRADKSTIFADGFLIPLGLELGQQGAYVSSGTELVHVRDRDGDGRADERRVVFHGFGTGDAHQTLNSFAWGPSGELMMSQGLHANSRIETSWGLAELRQAGLFRFWPRRLQLEPVWSGAMGAHNPFGTVFDRWGQPFVFAGNGHGIYHLAPALTPTDHFLLHPAIWQQGRKFGGADIVENTHWPADSQGEFIAGGYLQNSVERFRLRESGSTFKVERLPPLVESTNTAFRIVDVRFGPDGALYLCDWYNRLIGHYQTSLRDPGRDRSRGRIWRVTAKERPTIAWKALDAQTTESLLDELRSPERWNRQQAKRVLADRATAEVVPAARRWVERIADSDAHALFEALGVFVDHESPDEGLLRRLVASNEPGARAYAARVVGHWADRLKDPLALLARLVEDPRPRVRLEAIVACGYVADARAIEVAARATDHPMDNHLDYAFTQTVHALKPRWLDRQKQGLLTFDGKPSRAAAFARADGSGDTVGDATARLSRIAEVALDRETIERLGQILADSAGPRELPVLLRPKSFSLGDEHLTEVQAGVLERLARRVQETRVLPEGQIAPALLPLLESPSARLRNAAIRLAGTWEIDVVRDAIASIATNALGGLETRLAAVAALGGYAKLDDRGILESIAATAPNEPLRTAAILGLARFAMDSAAAATAALLAEPPNGEASRPDREATLRASVAALLGRRAGPDALTRAIESRRPHPSNAIVALGAVAASGRDVPDLVGILKGTSDRSNATLVTLADLPSLAREVREAGRPEVGRSLFEREALACTRCHAVDGTPGKIGPDLGALGTAQPVEYILGALVAPQKEVKEGFVAHEYETRDGSVVLGYIHNEDASGVSIWDHLSGQELRLLSDTIVSKRQVGSVMPPGLVDGLSRAELRDLAAYLAGLGRR